MHRNQCCRASMTTIECFHTDTHTKNKHPCILTASKQREKTVKKQKGETNRNAINEKLSLNCRGKFLSR